jgi:photosystem II stability/assembly factor-like uncharacterized protein
MKKLLLFILFWSPFLLTNFGFAQWTQNGLEGGIVNSIAVRSNGVLYTSTYKGVYFSANLGDNWQKGNNNLDQNSPVISIAFGTTEVYAVAHSSTSTVLFCKSTDNGYNFNTVGYYMFNANIILASGNIIYAGNNSGTQYYDGSVTYSTNGGSNWTQTNLSKTLAIYDLSISGSSLYASGDSGVYVTTNTGTSWTKLNNGLPGKITIYSFRMNGTNFYIGTDKGIYMSTNSGSLWTDITNGLPTYKPYFAIELKDNILFAANYSKGVYKTANNGANWYRCEVGLKDLLINKFLVYGSYIYAASLGGGVYASADYGENWYPKNTGFQGQCVYSMINNGTMVYAGTQGGGIYYSNNGTTWINLSSGLTSTIVYSIIFANNSLFTGTFGGIFKSTNNGNNWYGVNAGLLDSTVLCMTSNGATVLAGTQGGGLYKSDNWGATWYKANNGINSDTIKALAYLNNILFAGTNSKGIFRSTNGGQNWIASNAGFSYPPNPLTFCAKGTTIYAGNYGNGGFYASTDNGINWFIILAQSGNNVLTSLTYNNAVVVGIYNYGGGKILVTKNDGASWQDVSTGTSGFPEWKYTDIRSSLNYNGTYFLGTYGKSIYSIPFNQIIGIKQISSSVPDKFLLYQNYPNPFNPSTNIKYQITYNSHINLKVFDIRGKEVITLVNEKQSPGIYEVTFDGSNLNSGVYFYQLITDNYRETKKLLLIK